MDNQQWLKRLPKKPVLIALVVLGVLLILIGTLSSKKTSSSQLGQVVA